MRRETCSCCMPLPHKNEPIGRKALPAVSRSPEKTKHVALSTAQLLRCLTCPSFAKSWASWHPSACRSKHLLERQEDILWIHRKRIWAPVNSFYIPVIFSNYYVPGLSWLSLLEGVRFFSFYSVSCTSDLMGAAKFRTVVFNITINIINGP